jgi:hypothetical protein
MLVPAPPPTDKAARPQSDDAEFERRFEERFQSRVDQLLQDGDAASTAPPRYPGLPK